MRGNVWQRPAPGSPTLYYAERLSFSMSQVLAATVLILALSSLSLSEPNIACAQTSSTSSPSALGKGPKEGRLLPIVSRVLVLNYDPFYQGKRLHEALNFNDPRKLAEGYCKDMAKATNGHVTMKIVEWRDLDEIYARVGGGRFTVDEYVRNRRAGGGWPEQIIADYPRVIEEQGVVSLIDRGIIDEVWIFGDHYFGLWEASMAGPGAFFINGGVYPEVPSSRPFAFYGFNYERGVAEMMHNTAHRVESTMNRIYGEWNLKIPKNNWEKFSANVDQSTGAAGVGTCHWPANAAHDYDYGNTRVVPSWADDFLKYPNLTGKVRPVSVKNWSPDGKDPHRGYMNWYFARFPKAVGTNPDGRLNNWWAYVYDFQNYTPDGKPLPPSAEVVKCQFEAGNLAVAIAYRSPAGVSVAKCDNADVEMAIDGKTPTPASRVFVADKTPGAHRVATYVFSGVGKKLPEAAMLTLKDGKLRDLQGTSISSQRWTFIASEEGLESLRVDANRDTPLDVVHWILKVGGRVGLKGRLEWIEDPAQLPSEDGLQVQRISLLRRSGQQQAIGWRDLVHLQVFKELEELELRAQPVGDQATTILAKMQSLRILSLHDCQITDAALPEIVKLKDLTSLDLGFSHEKITDAGAKHLLELQHLKWLNIYASAITDDTMLNILAKLPDLESVEVTSTLVTPEGLQKFKTLKPKCNVIKY